MGRDGWAQGGGSVIEMTILSILHSVVSQRRLAFGLSTNGCNPVRARGGVGKELIRARMEGEDGVDRPHVAN